VDPKSARSFARATRQQALVALPHAGAQQVELRNRRHHLLRLRLQATGRGGRFFHHAAFCCPRKGFPRMERAFG
jgi:hypothetical protein